MSHQMIASIVVMKKFNAILIFDTSYINCFPFILPRKFLGSPLHLKF